MCRCRVIGICFPPMLLKIIDWGLKKTQRLREGYKRGLTKRLNDSLNRPEPLIRPTSHLELAKFAAVIRKSCAHAFASSLAHQISAFLSIEAPSPEQIKLYTVYFRLALYHPTIESIDECWDKHIKEVEAEIKKQKKMVRWPSQVKKAFHRLERSVNHLVDDWMEWRAMRKEARSLGAPPQPPI